MKFHTLPYPVFSATLFLALAGAVLAFSTGFGQLVLGAPPAGGAPTASSPLLAPPRADTTLTPEETEVLKRFDKNGDGRLDDDEVAAAHMGMARTELRARVGQMVYSRLLQAFDREHRGSLSPEEQAQAVEFLRANRPVIYQALLRRFDLNRDGSLDANETAAMFRALERISQGRGKKAGR